MVTLKQLAEKLGVSVSTVSKALNESDEISGETVNRVKELAQQLNYQPNRAALSLKSNKTKTIGVIIPNILNRFFAQALYGIQNEATKFGYNIITCITNEQLDNEQESISILSNGSVDGFIIAVSEETIMSGQCDHLQNLINKNIPMLMFDRNLNNIDCTKVIIDDYKASFELTNMLIKKGRNHFVFISTIEDLNVGVLRRKGFENAIASQKKLGLEPLILLIKRGDDYQGIIKSFLVKNPDVNAIIAADNVTGTIAVNIANSLGFNIPAELSIIGFSDELVSNLSVPKLSYIDQNAEPIGQKALKLIVDNINDNSNIKTSTVMIPVEIVHKETS